VRKKLAEQAVIDEFFMKEALLEARKAFEKEEVPVGAILVCKGKIIARAHNQIEMLQEVTAHAEVLCIRSASFHLNNWRLVDTTLYCTLEPCAMCLGAMILSRVHTLVWGAPDLRHGANGSWVDLLRSEHPIHQLQVRKEILKEESAMLMTEFFKLQRKKRRCLRVYRTV
jgi:tRNA(adenine34) deaminase